MADPCRYLSGIPTLWSTHRPVQDWWNRKFLRKAGSNCATSCRSRVQAPFVQSGGISRLVIMLKKGRSRREKGLFSTCPFIVDTMQGFIICHVAHRYRRRILLVPVHHEPD